MGLLGKVIVKGVATAAKHSTIRAVEDAVTSAIETRINKSSGAEDVAIQNGVVLINPTRPSDEYWDENALEIAKELLGAGFDSVTLKPVNTLNERAKKRYGVIESITINGKDEFRETKKVPASSYIVIKYFDFKKNVDASVYSSVERIIPGTMNRIEQKNEPSISDSVGIPISEGKRFCPYCGSALVMQGAKFCANCGKAMQ